MSFLAPLLAIAALALAEPTVPPPQMVAIVGAEVLPMTKAERLKDQTIILSGDRIVTVGPRAKVRVPPGARRIDAADMTLMPGLVDMHVHVPPEPGAAGDAAQRALAVLLGHGVTTARGMAGSPANIAVRSAVERGTLAGPRIYAATAPQHDGRVANAEAARTAVRDAKQAGFDLIKSHHITNVTVWEALQDEARKQGMPTAGHVTNEIGLSRALAAGQQIEHLEAVLIELLPKDAPERHVPFSQFPPGRVVAVLARATDADIAALARKVAAARSYQVPTLATFERVMTPDLTVEAMMREPEVRYVPPSLVQRWTASLGQMRQELYTPEEARAFTFLRQRITRAYADAGVPIMAGSDTAQVFNIWGIGLLREIEALGAAGLTPMAALRSATIVPRDYFRSLPNAGSSQSWRADFGTVEAGARADLILLRGDPSRDLKALHRLETVIAGGRVYDRAALDAMLDAAAADAAADRAAN